MLKEFLITPGRNCQFALVTSTWHVIKAVNKGQRRNHDKKL